MQVSRRGFARIIGYGLGGAVLGTYLFEFLYKEVRDYIREDYSRKPKIPIVMAVISANGADNENPSFFNASIDAVFELLGKKEYEGRLFAAIGHNGRLELITDRMYLRNYGLDLKTNNLNGEEEIVIAEDKLRIRIKDEQIPIVAYMAEEPEKNIRLHSGLSGPIRVGRHIFAPKQPYNPLSIYSVKKPTNIFWREVYGDRILGISTTELRYQLPFDWHALAFTDFRDYSDEINTLTNQRSILYAQKQLQEVLKYTIKTSLEEILSIK